MDPRLIVLVGQPNVGKSVVLNALTGAKAMVSNYAGTTVEVTSGRTVIAEQAYHIMDTPGTYTLHSDTDEQRVTQRILLEESPDLIVNVLDATNLDRGLYLTLQLMDFGVPMVVVVNQTDRARQKGLVLNQKRLEDLLGVPVVFTSAVKGEGMDQLKLAISRGGRLGHPFRFSAQVEEVIERLSEAIRAHEDLFMPAPGEGTEVHERHPLRTLAIHLLEHDSLDEAMLREHPSLQAVVEEFQASMEQGQFCPGCFRGCAFCPAWDDHHPVLVTCVERTAEARRLSSLALEQKHRGPETWAERIEGILDRPLTGLPILLALIAVTFFFIIEAIELVEDGVEAVIPGMVQWLSSVLGRLPLSSFWRDVLSQAVPEGLLLPIGVVLPAMLAVYLLMALLEDTGMLARIAVSLDRSMQALGFPGQAIVPFVLSFGCRAPAVLATRTLPGRDARLLALLPIGLVIPCASSLGILSAVIAKFGANLWVILGSMVLAFLTVSIVASRILKVQTYDLVLEVPPLRAPHMGNIVVKTWVRMRSFFLHVLPILLLAGIIVRILIETDVLVRLEALSPFTRPLWGLGGETVVGITATIIQRYVAPMVLLNLALTAREATIASTMVALSWPCLPVLVLVAKEMGMKAIYMLISVGLALPLGVGLLLNLILP